MSDQAEGNVMNKASKPSSAVPVPVTGSAISGAGDLGLSSSPMGLPAAVEELMDEAISDTPPTDSQEDLPPEAPPSANTEKPPPTPYDTITDDMHTTAVQNMKIEESNINETTTKVSGNNNIKELSQSASESSLSDKEIKTQITTSSDTEERSPDLDSDMYDFTNKKRGMALIFSFSQFNPETQQREREGAIEETKKLQVLMESLGFDAELVPNATKAEMDKKLSEAAAANHKDSDCFACILSSHGTQVGWYKEKHIQERTDIVFTKDGYVFIEDVIQYFREDKSPSLKGKPKLFFIQACRGHKVSTKVEIVDPPLPPADPAPPVGEMTQPLDPGEGGDTLDEKEGQIANWKPQPYICFNYPCYKDFLVSCSTLPGYFSFRSTERSWYFRELFDEFKTGCDDLEITEIMERINFKIAYNYSANTASSKNPEDWALDGKGQMPWVMSMLTKQMYLKPKTQEGASKVKTLKWSMNV